MYCIIWSISKKHSFITAKNNVIYQLSLPKTFLNYTYDINKVWIALLTCGKRFGDFCIRFGFGSLTHCIQPYRKLIWGQHLTNRVFFSQYSHRISIIITNYHKSSDHLTAYVLFVTSWGLWQWKKWVTRKGCTMIILSLFFIKGTVWLLFFLAIVTSDSLLL